MATIVQQYDPWAEKAAVNVIGGLINGLLQRHWQNEDNRKRNAFSAAVMSELDKRRGVTPQIVDYNSDPWARASQSMPDSALSQFDTLAEADNLPKYDIGKTGAVPIQSLQTPITIQDIQDAIIRTRASQPRRWARIDPQTAQADLLPYMQSVEQGRQEQLRNDLADSYGQAQDAAAKRDILMSGAISGFIPESMAVQGQNVYQYDNPQPQMWTQNDGKNIHMGTFTPNPINPSIIDTIQMANYMTPQQTADNSYRYAQLGENAREFNKNYDLNVRKQNAVEDETKYNRDNPILDTITAIDGTIYLINTRTGNVTEVKKPDGEVIKINPKASDVILKEDGNGNYFMFDRKTGRAFAVTDEDGNQVTAPQRGAAANSANKDMTDSQKKEYDDLREQAKQLQKDRKEYQQQRRQPIRLLHKLHKWCDNRPIHHASARLFFNGCILFGLMCRQHGNHPDRHKQRT